MTLTGNNVITLRKHTSKVTAEKGILPLKSLQNNLHQRETIYDKLIFFCKISKSMKVKRASKFGVRMSIINIHLLLFKI